MNAKQNWIKKGFLIALLFVSLFSGLLSVFLYAQVRWYYRSLYVVKLDPVGLSSFQEPFEQKPDETLQTFVFFGDSRAAQWPNPAVGGFWFVNRGIGSQTTPQILSRFDAHIAPLQPDVILVQMGINDLKTLPLFPDSRGEIISACKQNILQVVQRSQELNSVVILSTIFPTGRVPLIRMLAWSRDIEEAVVDVNNYIRSLATDQVIILDAEALLANKKGRLKPEYSLDELHLNQAGYDALNAELVKRLEEIQQDPQ